jgi:hypothetical protein
MFMSNYVIEESIFSGLCEWAKKISENSNPRQSVEVEASGIKFDNARFAIAPV